MQGDGERFWPCLGIGFDPALGKGFGPALSKGYDPDWGKVMALGGELTWPPTACSIEFHESHTTPPIVYLREPIGDFPISIVYHSDTLRSNLMQINYDGKLDSDKSELARWA